MARFNTNTFRSLNESIARIQNPIAALDEAMEYTSILETVILDLCEALDLDPQALVEDVMTTEREKELAGKIKKQGAKTQAAYTKVEDRLKKTKKYRETPTFKKEYAKSQKLGARYEKEGSSHKVYGRGGKVMPIKTSPSNDARNVRGGGYQGWSDQK